MILPYCHDDIRALKNCCMSQTKVALLSKSIYFAFASTAFLRETPVSQHIIPTSITQSATVRKQEDNHGFSADKRGGYLPLK